MSQMSVSEAIVKRHSVRAFLPKPVPKTVVEQVINTAVHAPSGSNIQPWKIHVFTGSALQQGIKALGQRLMSGEQDQPEFPTYPPKMGEPFRSRREACAERMYGALGIERDDRQGRMMQDRKSTRRTPVTG